VVVVMVVVVAVWGVGGVECLGYHWCCFGCILIVIGGIE